MAEQEQINILQEAINAFEQAVPLIVTPSKKTEGYQYVIQGADQLKQLSFDENFGQLSTSIKILTNGESPVLGAVSYQGFIVDILEMLVSLRDQIENEGIPQTTKTSDMLSVGEFLVRLAGRVTHRYKIKVLFEPEYEAKALRAFMVVKELSGVVRFLNMAPDISENQNANLDNGLEIDCLSQETPDELHRLAGSVLEVQNVQLFVETKPQPVNMLDPPNSPNSFDNKIVEFLNK